MTQPDNNTIIEIHRLAFGTEEGEAIAALTGELLALPQTLSFSTQRDGQWAGNLLFTPFVFDAQPEATCYLLAPLGVLPDYQNQGVGKELMETGMKQLTSLGTDAVFVLGIPSYYPHYGFAPTDKQTPYPDLLTIPEAWMACELKTGALARLEGKTRAVAPFMKALYWDTSGHEG
ncbi:GNAT family N-acetyltransferase [Rhodovibrionaceae bacterium A322]